MSDRNYEEEPLANLLDYEPELFLGATSSEVGMIVMVSSFFSIITITIAFVIFAIWIEIMPVAFASIPVSAIAIFISSVLGLKQLQKAKMNRPEGYHVILLELKKQKYFAFFGKKPHFVEHVGSWGVDRYV